MVEENPELIDMLFEGLSLASYLAEHSIPDLYGIDLAGYGDPRVKRVKDRFEAITQNASEPLPPELDDLCRLHWLATSRRVTTILEFGLGKSTLVFDDALKKNSVSYGDFVRNNLRRANAFECHSVDNNERWINEIKLNHSLANVTYHHSQVVVDTFQGRVCTFYESLPNICPDLIYLDGPDQFSVLGDIRGISPRHPDRLPMAADILAIEHFLLPGTLIVVDGRSANARFIKCNLQRDWVYGYSEELDQHFFELTESALGVYNKTQISFCLGTDPE